MKTCHVCQYLCEDDAELCPICGAELNLETDETEQETEIIIESPEIVATVNDVITAEVFCDRLKENNILFTTDEADLSASMHMGFGGFYTEINIYVDKADLDAAKAIYEDLPDMTEYAEDFDGEFDEEYEEDSYDENEEEN
ncbi:MAG: hypothetical protein IKI68_05770 [Clostridia bacterium]|nr:hypothetical protein [Clostridia bacterium]